jgi:hypothetical protein
MLHRLIMCIFRVQTLLIWVCLKICQSSLSQLKWAVYTSVGCTPYVQKQTPYIYISSDIYSVIYCLIYHVISHGFPMLAANTLAARPWASESWPRPLQIRWADHILRIHRYQPKDLMLGGFHKFDINGGTPKWMVYNGKSDHGNWEVMNGNFRVLKWRYVSTI